MQKSCLILFSILSLTGCVSSESTIGSTDTTGGNTSTDDGTATSETQPVVNGLISDVKATFGDGSGIIRFSTPSDLTEQRAASIDTNTGYHLITLAEDAASVLENLSASEIEAITTDYLNSTCFKYTAGCPENSSDLGAYPYLADYYEGRITIAGEEKLVSVFKNPQGSAYSGVTVDSNGFVDDIIVFGPDVSSVPSGTINYHGLHIMGLRETVNLNQGNAVGEFSISLNLDTGRGNLNADALSLFDGSALSVDGALTVDSASGEISASELSLGGKLYTTELGDMSATLDGQLFGESASEVGAIYWVDDGSVGGVLVGTKQ